MNLRRLRYTALVAWESVSQEEACLEELQNVLTEEEF